MYHVSIIVTQTLYKLLNLSCYKVKRTVVAVLCNVYFKFGDIHVYTIF